MVWKDRLRAPVKLDGASLHADASVLVRKYKIGLVAMMSLVSAFPKLSASQIIKCARGGIARELSNSERVLGCDPHRRFSRRTLLRSPRGAHAIAAGVAQGADETPQLGWLELVRLEGGGQCAR